MSKLYDSLNKIRAATVNIADWELDTDNLDKIVDQVELNEACQYYAHLKKAYSELDDARKKVFHHLDKLNKAVIPAKLEEAGLEDGIKVRISDDVGYTFRVQTQYSAKQKDREALYAWLRDRGDGELITETVNANTLASYLKNVMLEEGVEVPSDMAELTTYEITGMTKYTPKG